jgi:peptidoglycan/xylan/chitin deacetylase (PgdA/CDA1 family)
MATLRAAALSVATRTGLANLCQPLTRGGAVVFMLHRFTDPATGGSGFDPVMLRSLLAFLRRKRYEIIDLGTLLGRLRGEGAPLRRAVAFTIDDGYREQATVAAPVFAEFDAPVTTFVVTGFLDGALWLWWDRVAYVFRETARRELHVAIDGTSKRYRLDTPALARVAREDFTAACKEVPDAAKETAIGALGLAAEVAIPTQAPDAFAPMSWDELRAAERRGMTFGPHTVTHPILARTDDRQSEIEMATSWARLQAEARHPVPVFAYPNGRAADFGSREAGTAQRIGLRGACTGIPGYATVRRCRAPGGSFTVPRFPLPGDLPHVIQLVSGLERLKMLVRGEE